MPFASFILEPTANVGPSTLARPPENQQFPQRRDFRAYRNEEAVPNELDPPPGLVPSPDLDESEEEVILEEAEESDYDVPASGSREEEEENNDQDLEPIEPPVMLEESFPVPPRFEPYRHRASEHS